MKKIKILMFLVLFLSAANLMGQGKSPRLAVTLQTIKTDSLTAYDGEDVYYGIPDNKGKVVFTFKPGLGFRDVYLSISTPKATSLPLIMNDGYDLKMVTDMGDHSIFKGKGENEARVFNENYLSASKAWRAIKVEGHTPTQLLESFEAMFRTPKKVLEENKSKVSAAFYKFHYNFLNYQELGYKMDVPFWYRKYIHTTLSQSIPEGYWDLLKKIDLNGEVLETAEYKGAMFTSLPFFIENEYKFKSGHPDDTTFNELEVVNYVYHRLEDVTGGATREAILKDILTTKMGTVSDPASLKPLIDEYAAKYSSPANADNARALQNFYTTIIRVLPGAEPNSFPIKDINGKEVSLKDFAGKVIYMDFWASWCGPCRAEMKAGAPRLHDMFKDVKDVVFLYVNLDKTVDLGLKAIKDDNIKGTHVFAGDFKPENLAVQAFNISGIPRYVIIGKDGKIFDVDAPRPSEEQTPIRIREALNAK